MAEGSGSSNAPIWVAVITVVGSLLTALIVNGDKWMPSGSKAAVETPSAAAAPGQAGPAAATPAPETGKAGEEKAKAPEPPPTATPAEPAQAVPAPAAGPVNINGEWRDDEGAHYGFDQKGSNYELTHTAINGTMIKFSRGEINGRDLTETFEMLTGDKGSCNGRINEAGNRINGTCLYDSGSWTYTITR